LHGRSSYTPFDSILGDFSFPFSYPPLHLLDAPSGRVVRPSQTPVNNYLLFFPNVPFWFPLQQLPKSSLLGPQDRKTLHQLPRLYHPGLACREPFFCVSPDPLKSPAKVSAFSLLLLQSGGDSTVKPPPRPLLSCFSRAGPSQPSYNRYRVFHFMGLGCVLSYGQGEGEAVLLWFDRFVLD